MDRYSAPRPPRKKPQPRAALSASSSLLSPLMTPSSSSLCVMAIVRWWVLWPCCGGSRSAAMRSKRFALVTEVAPEKWSS